MIVWIAGWPHNGSTLLRQILKDAFDIPTYSRYLESELESLFPGGEAFYKRWSRDPIAEHRYWMENKDGIIIKTHELPFDDMPAIFVIRDGRDAVCSLSNFWHVPISQAIAGIGNAFGTWSSFYYGLMPEIRDKTLVLRFEDLVSNPDGAAQQIALFIGQNQVRPYVDDFEEKKKEYPYLFKDRVGVWKDSMSKADLDFFWKCHGNLMKELGYE